MPKLLAKPNWTNNARNEPATVAQAWNPLSGGGGGPCGARVDGAIIDSRPLAGLPPGTCFSMRSPISFLVPSFFIRYPQTIIDFVIYLIDSEIEKKESKI